MHEYEFRTYLKDRLSGSFKNCISRDLFCKSAKPLKLLIFNAKNAYLIETHDTSNFHQTHFTIYLSLQVILIVNN